MCVCVCVCREGGGVKFAEDTSKGKRSGGMSLPATI